MRGEVKAMIEAQINPHSDRAEDWRRVFGSTKVPIKSMLPIQNNGPHGRGAFYLLATRALTQEVRARLVEHVSKKFGVPPEEVERDLDDPRHGCPIFSEDVVVTVDARAFL